MEVHRLVFNVGTSSCPGAFVFRIHWLRKLTRARSYFEFSSGLKSICVWLFATACICIRKPALVRALFIQCTCAGWHVDLGYCIKTLQPSGARAYVVALSKSVSKLCVINSCLSLCWDAVRKAGAAGPGPTAADKAETTGRRGSAGAPGWLQHMASAMSAPLSSVTEGGGSAPQGTSSGTGHAVLSKVPQEYRGSSNTSTRPCWRG